MKLSRITTAGLATLALLLAAPVLSQDVKDRELKFSYVLTPETPLGLGAAKFAEIIQQKSGGKIKVKLFPGGSLGGDIAMISSLQGGLVDFTAVNAGLLYGQVKDYAVLDIPYLFNNVAEADAVVDGPVGKALIDQLPAKGLIGLAFWEYGFRNLSNSKRPVTKLEDLQGLKIRVVQAPIYIDTFNALGVQRHSVAAARALHCTRTEDGRRTGESPERDPVQQVLRGQQVRVPYAAHLQPAATADEQANLGQAVAGGAEDHPGGRQRIEGV